MSKGRIKKFCKMEKMERIFIMVENGDIICSICHFRTRCDNAEEMKEVKKNE